MRIDLKSQATIPMYRSLHSLRVLIQAADDAGVETEALLAEIGLQRTDLDDPEQWISIHDEHALTQRILSLVRDPAFGLKLAERYHITQFNPWVMAAMSCQTVLEAIQLAFAYLELTSPAFQYILEARGERATLRLREVIDLGSARRYIIESQMVILYRLGSEALHEPIQLQTVRFAFPEPAYASAYRHIFHCPVTFDAPESMVSFDSEYLAQPLPLSNPLTKNIYEKECQRLLQAHRHFTSTTALARHVLLAKDLGILKMEHIARHLHMSTQTLRRRLSAEGTTFKALLRVAREQKALDLIRSTPLSMEAIAQKLGYNDVPTFYRAFKTWTGRTPMSYREKPGAGGGHP